MKNKEIKFDPCDWDGMISLMEEYGDSDTMMYGKNEDGEDVTVAIFKDRIWVDTEQKNGWLRTNVYWNDGTVEELYKKNRD